MRRLTKYQFNLTVMRPEAEDFDRLFLFDDLVDESVLDIDSARIGTFEIAH